MKVRIELVGGPRCGHQDTTVEVDHPAGELPALYIGPAGEQYLRTDDHIRLRDGLGQPQSTGPRRYEYCVPAAQLGLPRPQRANPCCAVPGRGCPAWEPS